MRSTMTLVLTVPAIRGMWSVLAWYHPSAFDHGTDAKVGNSLQIYLSKLELKNIDWSSRMPSHYTFCLDPEP
jgi:hypothetical protein